MSTTTTTTMKAFGLRRLGGAEVLEELKLGKPEAGRGELLVRVKACGMNPVDYKLREENFGAALEGTKVLGYDCSGVVEGVGEGTSGAVRVGDEVYFAGLFTRAGSNAEYTVVDERIVARKPRTVGHEEAAGLPLVGITAWEAIFETMRAEAGKTLLVVPGGGGVGSAAIQLGRVAGLRVVATASRPETAEWCRKLGADVVINVRGEGGLGGALREAGVDGVDYVLDGIGLETMYDAYAEALRPLGTIVTILPAAAPVDLSKLFVKRGTVACEMMFARPLLGAAPERQGELLRRLAALVDDGTVVPVTTTRLPLTLDGLREAHRLQESGKAIGKIVLSFDGIKKSG